MIQSPLLFNPENVIVALVEKLDITAAASVFQLVTMRSPIKEEFIEFMSLRQLKIRIASSVWMNAAELTRVGDTDTRLCRFDFGNSFKQHRDNARITEGQNMTTREN